MRLRQLIVLILPASIAAAQSSFLTLPLGVPTAVTTGWFDDAYINSKHRGIDFSAVIGVDVLAADAGWAIASCQPPSLKYPYAFGNFVLIQHANGHSSLYGHLGQISLPSTATLPCDDQSRFEISGNHNLSYADKPYTVEWVTRGQPIGKVGGTGTSQGPHLHFEVAANLNGSYASHYAGKLDPYAIEKTYLDYPPRDGGCSSQNVDLVYLWTQCPPVTPNQTPPLNQPPTARFTMTFGTQAAGEGQTLNVTVPAGRQANIALSMARSTDFDGSVAGGEITIDGVPFFSFIGTPTVNALLGVGSHTISVVVSDNQEAPSPAATATVIVTEAPPPPPAAGELYSVTDLGTLPGGTNSQAYAISNDGVVVGESEAASDANYNGCGFSPAGKPFIWTAAGGMQVLGPPPVLPVADPPLQACGGRALGMNDQGIVVGNLSYGSLSGYWPFIWSAATGMQLMRRADGSIVGPGLATDINNTGHVVGLLTGNAFRWSPGGGIENLGIPYQSSYPNAINESRSVAGFAGSGGCDIGSAIWSQAGQLQFLNLAGLISTLPPYQYLCQGNARGINDLGVVIGSLNVRLTPETYLGPFAWIYRNGNAQGLGELPGTSYPNTTPYGITNDEQVVGTSNGHAFLWTATTAMRDLNLLLDSSGEGWALISANAINSNGQIVGYGNRNGQRRAFRLTPGLPANQPPTAGFTMTSIPLAPVSNGQTLTRIVAPGGSATIYFDGASPRSSDPEGTITGWLWTVNGAQVATTASFSSTFTVGSYSVSLVVTDNQGVQSTAASGTVIVRTIPGGGEF